MQKIPSLPYVDVTVPAGALADLSGGASVPYLIWGRGQIAHLAKLVPFKIESLPLVIASQENGDRIVRVFGRDPKPSP